MEQYARLAQVYDEFMYDVPYEKWAAYLVGLMQKGQERNTVLEYACGTGNITLELCRAGYDVCGVDISTEMLDVAAQKLRANAFIPQLACADMSAFLLNSPVDAVVCACDGVNYILDKAALGAFFHNVHANLKKDGIFLFDISSAYKLQYILGNEFFYDDSDDGTLFWQNRYDVKKRLITMELSLFIPKNGVYHRCDERHVQRAWTIKEIKDALKKAGFADVIVNKFMTMRPISEKDERKQFICNVK